MAKTEKKGQLTAFRDSLRAYGLAKCKTPRTWIEAFNLLKLIIEQAQVARK